MKTIPSFTIDHERLLPGVYVSRKDNVGEETVTTFDIRMKRPNKEEPLDGAALHTIEHLAATFLRNDRVWGERILYWGGMGCLTGSYLLVKGDYKPTDILPVLKRMFRFISEYEGEIPGSSPKECGNSSYHNLALAKLEATKFYFGTLLIMKPENMEYPK